ncbi:Hypothetical Protein FCC1311_069102 [Hondaea fermentalgiana]|uniref:Uncharacterized protein n=1 Tax=Hondaea fermentalgiana TaxID=2315210 RepID=A0A2R5GIG8_9STRA|nr:Hypothetical Protein FCC1311_069102 [Hondaea fermentalgiana]|eukprot:GBG30690.1 Hypothetical Protein FCC1311_069102 [Hondaea fermentalgiana]
MQGPEEARARGAMSAAAARRGGDAGGDIPDFSMIMINGGVRFAKRNKVTTGMWIFGLVLVLFATGFQVSHQEEQTYNRILSKIDYKRLDAAQQQVYVWQHKYAQSKGWFSCDEACHENYENLRAAQDNLYSIEKEFASISSEAKQTVGIFSEYGVQEVRELFWSQFAGGREFAQRSSWYDFIFMSISSMGRDESLVEFGLRLIVNMLLNFTIGLIGALVGFYYYLWGVVAAYQPSFLLAVGFFFLASVAATSLVAAYLAGLYSAAAGTVFVAAKIATQSARLNDDARRAQDAFLRQRPHRD